MTSEESISTISTFLHHEVQTMVNKESVDQQLGDAEMSEDEIDRNLKETFPASDPPSWTLGTDHRDDPASEGTDVAEDGEAE